MSHNYTTWYYHGEPRVYASTSSDARTILQPTASSLESTKNMRGISRGLKASRITRTTNERIRIVLEKDHLRPSKEVHSTFASFVGAIIRADCPMLFPSWEKVDDAIKRSIMGSISVNYDIRIEDPDVARYMEKLLRKVYTKWKHELHREYNMFGSADEALTSPPSKMASRLDQWHWLCTHFQNSKFLARSQFLELDNYGDVYGRPDNYGYVYGRPDNEKGMTKNAEMLAKKASYLEEVASQYPPDTPLESISVPDRDAGLRIITETLGVRRGREIRGIGAGRVRDLSARSSSQPYVEFVNLSTEVQLLRGQLEEWRAAYAQHTSKVHQMEQMFGQLAKIVPGFVLPSNIDQCMPGSSTGADDVTDLRGH